MNKKLEIKIIFITTLMLSHFAGMALMGAILAGILGEIRFAMQHIVVYLISLLTLWLIIRGVKIVQR